MSSIPFQSGTRLPTYWSSGRPDLVGWMPLRGIQGHVRGNRQSAHVPAARSLARLAAGKKELERSPLVNEEIIYFIFQLELDAQLQRALNYESYESAQNIRTKRETVELAMRRMQEKKGTGSGAGGAVTLTEVDFASEGLRIRTELQRAVEEERYADAAKFRDLLSQLEQQSKRAAAASEQLRRETAEPLLRLGQRVLHRLHNYRGVVVGWDRVCCESDEWAAAVNVAALPRGASQPFYHLLVDIRDWQYDAAQPPVAYAPEELLIVPEAEEGKTWVEAYGEDELRHPYSYMLFLGRDAAGDMVPTRQLRDKYNVPRRDVFSSEEDSDVSGEEPLPGKGPNQDGDGGPGKGGDSSLPGIDMRSLQ